MTNRTATMVTGSAPVGLIAGYTLETVEEMTAEAIIDKHRYADDTDRILARYEEVPALFPDTEELSRRGVNIIALANALEEGLDAELFGQLFGTFDIESLNQSLTSGIDMPTFNFGMEHLVERARAHEQFGDDFVSEVLARHGE